MASVVVNARCLGRPITGVERYTREITRRLGDRVRLSRPRTNAQGLRGHLWEQLALPRAVNGDVLWSPANTGPIGVSRQVLTIHDLSPIEHPEWFTPRFAAWYRYLLPRLARRVRRVLTVSQFTRSRLIERLGLPEDRVVVIPNGVDESFRPRRPGQHDDGDDAVLRRYGIEGPYVLTVASLEPRKNLPGLLRAWELASPATDAVTLVIVGGLVRSFPAPRFARVPHGVRLVGTVKEGELHALYRCALGFALPSAYEGFGLTALEAMASGTPVVASTVAALPEVVGDAAISIDPFDAGSIADGLRRLLVDAELRESCRRRGLERARQFSWDRSARLVWQALEEARDG